MWYVVIEKKFGKLFVIKNHFKEEKRAKKCAEESNEKLKVKTITENEFRKALENGFYLE
jgi:hypothetical protein